MARIMGDTDAADEYAVWLKLAKKSYSEKLWNGKFHQYAINSDLISIVGKYYDYDSSVSMHHDSIMSDQLAGFWYLRLSGHKHEVMIFVKICLYLFCLVGFRKRTSGQCS